MAKPKKRRSRGPAPIWIILDKYLVVISAGLVAGVWLASDIAGLDLSQGTQAAMLSFVGYALLKSKTDARWREVELEKGEMDHMVAALEKSAPGSPEVLAVRRQLVELASRAQGDGGGEP